MASKDKDAGQKTEVLDWIEAVSGAPVPRDVPFEKALKDGIILCNLMNKIVPGSVKRINKKGGNFVLMENLAAFQKAVKNYGVPDEDIFQTVDLFEARNVSQVLKSLFALARTCQVNNFEGPSLGPKMSEQNARNFTAEQNRQGRDANVSLQYGSNKGASQAGLNMGKQRMITDDKE